MYIKIILVKVLLMIVVVDGYTNFDAQANGGHHSSNFCHSPTQPQHELELDFIMDRNL